MINNSLKQAKEGFSPDRVYCSRCLHSLISALLRAELHNEEVFKKLGNAQSTAEKYGINSCIY